MIRENNTIHIATISGGKDSTVKIEEIKTSKSLIIKNQNNLPVLEQELIEIKNRIKKIGEINAWQ